MDRNSTRKLATLVTLHGIDGVLEALANHCEHERAVAVSRHPDHCKFWRTMRNRLRALAKRLDD